MDCIKSEREKDYLTLKLNWNFYRIKLFDIFLILFPHIFAGILIEACKKQEHIMYILLTLTLSVEFSVGWNFNEKSLKCFYSPKVS